MACFAYLAFFAYIVTGILRKQGIDIDKAPDDLNELASNPEGGLKPLEVKS